MRLRIPLAPLLSLAVFIPQAFTLDWPQWRGVHRDGKSTDTGLLKEWPAAGPPLAWQASGVGGGFSSVSIAGRRLFTMGDLGDDQFIIALREEDGSNLWKTRIGPAWTNPSLYPVPVPLRPSTETASTRSERKAISSASG